ncbi:SGNH/GDSL hydrolase family protein [Acholeplasma hippikon]|uniref:GDSL-like Lipase/Acylhydrolase n=1 Tax=Acholeplasma hippikon TaxID=264636 RepID=A0A449BLG2_9MOLU|nr:GDSL-type esterase/lipase family protein [Acholeplasma hippikon]VEU83274.1 GDSL-like Lipase/Acylhydrolase [Acholeplasma hippikon]
MLTIQELQALRDMINKTSSAVIEKYKKINNKDSEILFIGDSMVEYFSTSTAFAGQKISNRGVAGATSKLILDNLDDITGEIDPKKIFLSVGSNNLVLLEENPEEAALGVKKLIDELMYIYPFATIYYLSTTPVVSTSSKVYKKLYVAGRKNEDNQKINEIIKSYCNNENLVFINQYDSLLDSEGFLREDITPDGIHLNKKGYEIYASNIIPYLKETC